MNLSLIKLLSVLPFVILKFLVNSGAFKNRGHKKVIPGTKLEKDPEWLAVAFYLGVLST